ncbi:unnamed protein product, partial [Symbiodinium pilosum]
DAEGCIATLRSAFADLCASCPDPEGEVMQGWKWLCLNPVPAEGEQDEHLFEMRAFYSQKLFDSVQLHTQVPQLLGSGRTALSDKVGAHVLSSLLEAGSLDGLQAYLDSCIGWCSDMGVEIGVPECQVTYAETMLPSFIRPVRVEELPCDDDGFVEEGPVLPAQAAQASASQNLMANALHARLSVEQWGRLRAEWDKAGAFISENLKIRLGFYQGLPWVILGGTHPDREKAMACLQQGQHLWDALPGAARHLQHRLAKDLFTPGPLHDDLQHFLSGEFLEDCPSLEAFLAPLTFIQIAERIIEGAHKDLGVLPKYHSMTALSIELRAPELNRSLSLRPELFGKLLECFQAARKIRKVSSIFPFFRGHPRVRALDAGGAKTATSKYVTQLRTLLYRDSVVQHGDIRAAAGLNESHKAQRDKLKRGLEPKEPPLSQAILFGQAAVNHVRQVCGDDPGAVLSLRDGFWAPVILRPSAIHKVSHAPLAIASMNKNDILVSKLENFGTADAPTVSALSEGPRSEVLNLCSCAHDMGLDAFLSSTRLWRKQGEVCVSVPSIEGVPDAHVAGLVQRMVKEHALSDCVNGVVPARGSEEEAALRGLVHEGFAEETCLGARLTSEGVAALTFRHILSSPLPLTQARNVPLAELSVFELMVSMRSKGWAWSALPSKKADRLALKFSPGDPLVFYTAGVTVCKSYLLCLLDAENLSTKYGVASIPHSLPPDAYDLILQGMQPAQASKSIENMPKRGKKRGVNLDLDVEVCGELQDIEPEPALPAVLPAEGVVAPDHPVEEGEESHDSLERELERLIEQEAEELVDEVTISGSAAAAVATGPDDSKGSSADGAAAAASRDVSDSVPVKKKRGGHDAQVRRLPRLAPWGPFIFHRKHAAASPPFGGVECVCPYHALNSKTGCKKFVSLQGPLESDEERCLLTLKHWANQAQHFNRQRSHLKMPLRPADIPSAGIVLQQKPTGEAPRQVRTDVELDLADGAAHWSSVCGYVIEFEGDLIAFLVNEKQAGKPACATR